MSARTARRLPAAIVADGDLISRAGKWRRVTRIGAGRGVFEGLLELHTEGPYTRPWPVEVDQAVPVMLDVTDERCSL